MSLNFEALQNVGWMPVTAANIPWLKLGQEDGIIQPTGTIPLDFNALYSVGFMPITPVEIDLLDMININSGGFRDALIDLINDAASDRNFDNEFKT